MSKNIQLIEHNKIKENINNCNPSKLEEILLLKTFEQEINYLKSIPMQPREACIHDLLNKIAKLSDK